MGWGCRGSWWGLLRADLKEKREQGPRKGHGRCKGLDVQGQSCQSPGGQGQRSHGVSGLSRVKPLVPGSGERLILLKEGRELG